MDPDIRRPQFFSVAGTERRFIGLIGQGTIKRLKSVRKPVPPGAEIPINVLPVIKIDRHQQRRVSAPMMHRKLQRARMKLTSTSGIPRRVSRKQVSNERRSDNLKQRVKRAIQLDQTTSQNSCKEDGDPPASILVPILSKTYDDLADQRDKTSHNIKKQEEESNLSPSKQQHYSPSKGKTSIQILQESQTHAVYIEPAINKRRLDIDELDTNTKSMNQERNSEISLENGLSIQPPTINMSAFREEMLPPRRKRFGRKNKDGDGIKEGSSLADGKKRLESIVRARMQRDEEGTDGERSVLTTSKVKLKKRLVVAERQLMMINKYSQRKEKIRKFRKEVMMTNNRFLVDTPDRVLSSTPGVSAGANRASLLNSRRSVQQGTSVNDDGVDNGETTKKGRTTRKSAINASSNVLDVDEFDEFLDDSDDDDSELKNFELDDSVSFELKDKNAKVANRTNDVYRKLMLKNAKRNRNSLIRHVENRAAEVSVESHQNSHSLRRKSSAMTLLSQQMESNNNGIAGLNDSFILSHELRMDEADQNKPVHEIYSEACSAERKEQWRRAILLATVCMHVDEEWMNPLLLRSRCFTRLGLWSQVLWDLSKAIRLNTRNYNIYIQRAYIYTSMKEFGLAMQDLSLVIDHCPSETEAYIMRAKVHISQGHAQLGLKDLSYVIEKMSSHDWRAYYERALLRHRVAEGDELVRDYRWESIGYAELLQQLALDYYMACRNGCMMTECVECYGDVWVRVYECVNNMELIKQGIGELRALLRHLEEMTKMKMLEMGTATRDSLKRMPIEVWTKESSPSLIAAILSQLGRFYCIAQNLSKAQEVLNQSLIVDYQYCGGHYYRGIMVSLAAKATLADYERALQDFTKVVDMDPNITGAYVIQGAIQYSSNEYKLALKAFRKAVTIDPTLEDIWIQMGLIYLRNYHDSEACVQSCSSALRLDITTKEALYLRAEAYTRQGRKKQALRDYIRISMMYPDERWSYFLRGHILLQLNQPRCSLYNYLTFVDRENDYESYLMRGKAYKILDDFTRASSEFRKAVEDNPTTGNLCLLSESLHSMGDTEGALEVIERAIADDPNSLQGILLRARCFDSMKQFQRAIAEYTKAISLAPDTVDIYHKRALSKVRYYMQLQARLRQIRLNATIMKKIKASIDQEKGSKEDLMPTPLFGAKKAINVKAAANAVAILRGGGMSDEQKMLEEAMTTMLAKKTYEDALHDFKTCFHMNRVFADALVDCGETFVLGGFYFKALKFYSKAIKQDPTCTRAYMNSAVLHSQFMRFSKAIKCYDQAIQANEDFHLAYYNRAVVYQNLGNHAQAERDYTKAIEYTKSHLKSKMNRGVARAQIGDYYGALEDFKTCLAYTQDDVQLYTAMGYCLMKLGKYDEATNFYRTTSANNPLAFETLVDSGNTRFSMACDERVLNPPKFRTLLTTAKRAYMKAFFLNPSEVSVLRNLANCFYEESNYRVCLKLYTNILKILPDDPQSYDGRALVYYQLGMVESAIEDVNYAIHRSVLSDPSIRDKFLCFGSFSIKTRRKKMKDAADKAEKENLRKRRKKKTVKKTPSTLSSVSSSSLGSKQTPTQTQTKIEMNVELDVVDSDSDLESNAMKNGESLVSNTKHGDGPSTSSFDETRSNLYAKASVETKKSLARLICNRGVYSESITGFEASMVDYQTATTFNEDCFESYFNMGSSYLTRGEFVLALKFLEKAVQIRSKSVHAHSNIAVIYLEMNRIDAAIEKLEFAASLDEKNSSVWANLATAQHKKGLLTEAEKSYTTAIHYAPMDASFYVKRGRLIAQQFRFHEALVDFSTALFLDNTIEL